jgi:hypothetical protein
LRAAAMGHQMEPAVVASHLWETAERCQRCGRLLGVIRALSGVRTVTGSALVEPCAPSAP